MKIALLTDVINEHSGARAAIKLGEALAKIDDCEAVFFGSDLLLDKETQDWESVTRFTFFISRHYFPFRWLKN